MLKKLVKNQKGFTLIELMMVIAVIGILAAVLVPKMGGIKTSAKESGIEANVRMVEAHANVLISKYSSDAEDITNFETALSEKLGTDIVNPISNNFLVYSDNTSPTEPPAVIYSKDNDVNDNHDKHDTWAETNNNLKGTVVYAAINDGGILKCEVFYYDNDGKKSATKRTIQ